MWTYFPFSSQKAFCASYIDPYLLKSLADALVFLAFFFSAVVVTPSVQLGADFGRGRGRGRGMSMGSVEGRDRPVGPEGVGWC